jgi:hypothetical protein
MEMSLRKFAPYIFVAVFLLSTLFSSAQRGFNLEYGIGTGVSNYLGEIGGGLKKGRPFLMDVKFAKSRWNEQAYIRYKFDPIFSAKVMFNYLRIEGDDKLTANPGRQYRNLSFRNEIYDLEGTLQWLFLNTNKPMGVYSRTNIFLTAYLFAGVGAFHHNPKALYQGNWVALQPLKTENVAYSKWGYCIPLGVGAFVTLTKGRRSHRFGLEVNWRYTNTDYLDDVSTNWVDPALLSSSLSAALSNRNPEVERQPDGMQYNYGFQGVDKDGRAVNQALRGNKNNKDSYISINVTYGIALKNGKGRMSKGGGKRGRRIRTVTF